LNIDNLLKLPNVFVGGSEENVVSLITTTGGSGQISPQAIGGQFSLAVRQGDHYYLIRDRLGINKLFYHLDPEGRTVTVGNYIHDVAAAVRDLNRIFSVPPGHFLKIDAASGTHKLVSYYDISETDSQPAEAFDPVAFRDRVHTALSRFFSQVKAQFPDSLFCVCLSGGLDSSLIASYASEYLDPVVATTFSYQSGPNGTVSEDFTAASAIAAHLGLRFEPILAKKEIATEVLDTVLRYGQDWRDFNVHCAWVNHLIGREMRRRFPLRRLVFLTGDLMNEFVADYTPVTYGGATYYPQPKISKERLRRFFIYGLDTSDREIGIFHQWDITTLQPYSVVAEEYLGVPAEILNAPHSKETLNLPLISNPKVQESLTKTKVRAQVGGSDGGTLGMFHDHDISQSILKTRWEKLFLDMTANEAIKPMIISGRYRSDSSSQCAA